jgi:hypothetical protein
VTNVNKTLQTAKLPSEAITSRRTVLRSGNFPDVRERQKA